jgi:hypothetical protein
MTHFTMYADPGSRPDLTVTVRPDARAQVCCHTYDDRAPIWSLSHLGIFVTITPTEAHQVDEANLAFARDLAEAANTYLADLQRHADQTDRDGTADQESSGVEAAAMT